jgi:Holliday junction DNA helicase RuvB
MEDYSVNELKELANRCAAQLNVTITDDAAEEVAERSQGSYRQLTKMMKRARDFAIIKGNGKISTDILTYVINIVE